MSSVTHSGRDRGRRLLALAGICAALAWLPLSAAALELRVDSAALPEAQQQASAAAIDEVARALPTAWKAALAEPVRIEWRDDLPADVHGRATGQRIVLRRALLDPALGASPGEPSPAAVALVHELAHLLDRSTAAGYSRDPRLLDLAGWRGSALGGHRERRNGFAERSPDRYELTNPREYVAVNLEHFVFDREYACRRPALYRYFAARLGERPRVACAPGLAYVQADTGDDSDSSTLLEIDPERVHEIDYLLAEPDAALMSRWGHGMLRLVICAPGRARGPACRLDLAHHRVLSFRAFVDDVQISSWRGLTGSYPSRLFVLPLTQVIDEYTKVELRGLRSIPLRLQRDEIAALLERASQVHWSYDGRYYFVSNNCAVETYRLLHDGVPRLGAMRLASLTPTGLLSKLESAGVADARVLDDMTDARRAGYYFDSQAAHFEAMLDAAQASLPLPARRAREWLDMHPARRAPWIERADLRAAAALLVLEGAALRRQEHRARSTLKRHLVADGGREGVEASEAREMLTIMDRLTRPAALLPGAGYGLPQGSERKALSRVAVGLAAQWRERGGRLQAQARAWLPVAQREALTATEANMARLGDRLRTLHGEAEKVDSVGATGIRVGSRAEAGIAVAR